MHTPGRGEGALRRHRVSVPGASYFLTLCIDQGDATLLGRDIAPAIQNETDAIEADGHWLVRAAVIMPDHVHLLVRLRGALPLSRCIARLKSKTRQSLSLRAVKWQPNFYEHRLRPDDPIEDVVRYIFLNPYRAGLVSEPTTYLWFWMSREDREWFTPLTSDGRPFPEWLR